MPLLMMPVESQESARTGSGTKVRSRLQTVITGSGRSGTTLLAGCFLEGGAHLGAVSPMGIGIGDSAAGGGLEHQLFVSLNDRMLAMLENGASSADICRELGTLMGFSWPDVLKDPRFSETIPVWGEAGMLPERVFLCIRDPQATTRSMAAASWVDPRKKHDFSAQYSLISYCLKYDIPLVLVLFPRIGKDEEYARRILAPYFTGQDVWGIVRRVWDESLLHFA